jgi:hypothetical protein
MIENERLQGMVADHPFMSASLAARREELVQELESLPVGDKEPRTVLFFSGEPVLGSLGIDANFAGQVLIPFQSMVMTDYAHRHHGIVGSRGRRTGESQSRLLLTGLPRGSFGLELTKAEGDELFEDDQLADTLAHVTRLVEASARSDEDFAAELDDAAPRVIQNLRDFLGVVSKANASLTLESGDTRCSLSPEVAADAFERVSGTLTKDEEIEVPGVFRGVLLDSWRYDFNDENGHKLSGRLDDDLGVESVVDWNREYFDRPCVARLLKTTVVFKNGRVRTTYRLLGLRPVS